MKKLEKTFWLATDVYWSKYKICYNTHDESWLYKYKPIKSKKHSSIYQSYYNVKRHIPPGNASALDTLFFPKNFKLEGNNINDCGILEPIKIKLSLVCTIDEVCYVITNCMFICKQKDINYIKIGIGNLNINKKLFDYVEYLYTKEHFIKMFNKTFYEVLMKNNKTLIFKILLI